MAYPKDYRYTKEHEWIQVKGNTALVGATMMFEILCLIADRHFGAGSRRPA